MSKAPTLKTSWKERITQLLRRPPAPGEKNPYFKHYDGLGEIEPVFVSGGVQYYRFTNEQRVPSLRAFAAKDVWAELNWKITTEHLRASLLAVLKLLNQGKAINAGVIVQTLLDRLDYITHVDLLYKLASVLYFDAYENPLDWDPVYADRKTAAWKQNTALDAFFLQTPMIELLPFGDLSKIDFQGFTNAQRKAELSHLMMISRIVSSPTENGELSTFLTSQMETLQSLIS